MTGFADWWRYNATSATLDPTASPDDLEPLRDIIGDARVVAIGENAHHVREFYQVRHRVLRFAAERCGFRVLAFEAPFLSNQVTDEWIQGGSGTAGQAAADAGFLAQCGEMRDLLTWMRQRNQTADKPLRFTGTLAGLDNELHQLAAFCEDADPDAVPLVNTAIEIAESWSADNSMAELRHYIAADRSDRDRLTAVLSRLVRRMESMSGLHSGRSCEYATAMLRLRSAWHADLFHRDIAGDGIAVGTTNLDAFMAESVLSILDDDPEARVLLAVHNVHIRRNPAVGSDHTGLFPAGYRLAQVLGDDFVSIALTSNHGDLVDGTVNPDAPWGFDVSCRPAPAAEPDSIEAALDCDTGWAFADLRAARQVIGDAKDFTRIRMQGDFQQAEVFEDFDAIGYVPRTSATEAVGTAAG